LSLKTFLLGAVGSENVKTTVTGQQKLTKEMAVVILVPPEAPTTKRGTPMWSTNIEGVMEDMGRFFGAI